MHFDESYFDEEIREGFLVHPMIKRVWAAQLEVLEEIDRICKKYKIMYFAEWGTLLGAFSYWTDDFCRFARKFAIPSVVLAAVSVILIMMSHGALYRHGVVLSLQCLAWFAVADCFVRLSRYRWFVWTSECAFFIYVFHNQIQWSLLMRPMIGVWNALPPSITACPGVFTAMHVVVFVLSVTLCVLMYRVINRFVPLLARTLNGNL